ncbi:MAG: lipoate--protein ligase family protein [Candidatus Thorarchaeota archaeon]|nr:MAG: lipoate--protein ligase family protein [Candidatus Thorarchaeota archaeon]
MVWRLLDDGELNIYRNLSIEESLARVNAGLEEKVNTLRFWRSRQAVVIGRFQCVHKEVNLEYCKRYSIPVARRFTGGGAVYHDEGNLNVTLCLDQKERGVSRTLGELYWNFFGRIASGLQDIGIPARFDPDWQCLRIDRKKITGTAGWLKSGVSFLHGTLLIDADLGALADCLKVPPNQPVYLRDKSKVRCKESRRDVVTTIASELESRPSNEEIKSAIRRSMEKMVGRDIEKSSLTDEEVEVAESLYQTRYRLSEWNLGIKVEDSNNN